MGPCKHCHRLTCICEPIAYTDHDRADHLSTLSARVVEVAVMVEHYEKAMDPYNDRHLSDAEWREWCDLRDLRDEARLALRAAVDALIAERQR